jgi:hypothetical protein
MSFKLRVGSQHHLHAQSTISGLEVALSENTLPGPVPKRRTKNISERCREERLEGDECRHTEECQLDRAAYLRREAYR